MPAMPALDLFGDPLVSDDQPLCHPARPSGAAVRIPTREEYRAFNGLHCHRLWRGRDDAWRCPGCARSKFELMAWARRRSGNAVQYGPIGWVTGLHFHHDHSPLQRFPPAVVCCACNAVDGAMKRFLKLPASFSYAPAEIREFIRPRPHQGHVIDRQAALALWIPELKQRYHIIPLRMNANSINLFSIISYYIILYHSKTYGIRQGI
jgi:hypothetical protein